MSDEPLFDLAVEFAVATGHAATYRTRAELIQGEDTTDADRAQHWDRTAREHRDALRERLQAATARTVHALPNEKLPVATGQRGRVEVRAVTADGARAVRVRYSAAQALETGAALIACAAVTDERIGGTLAGLIATLPSHLDTEPKGGQSMGAESAGEKPTGQTRQSPA